MKEYEFKKDIPKEKRFEVILFSYQYFGTFIRFDSFNNYLLNQTNWENSFYLVDEDNIILGVYLIGYNKLPIQDVRFLNLKGVEGLLLAVTEELRGLGFGNRFKDMPKSLGIDYIWGQQYKSLNNLTDWLKRRELIGETNDVYITAEIF